VCKNIRDYLIYFLTLTLSVSLFYAFNSISDQPAFSNMGMTGTLLYRQLGIMLSTLSTMIAVVLAFLILYANQFLLKRRKKELGVYMMLGMKKGRISRLFAGETLCVGIIALGTGLLLGFFFSQGFSLIALRLFAINLEKFRIVFSAGALRQTVLCFTIIFFIVMLFNIRSVTNVKLIDLLTDGRKNESMQTENRTLAMQNKAPITLNDGQYLLNCNYNGTYRYVAAALQSHPEITVGGATLQRAEDKVLQETYIMTSVGNNDRGTLIVPDSVTASLEKDVNALLVQYEPNADSNEVLQKMIPIGLDSTHGYRYAEKNMMYETFYGLDALVSFLCCYIGLVFLLICAALLALKQLTETTDNVYRYGLLQKLGAGRRQIDHTLLVQTAVFFAIPLVVAGVYSAFLIGKAMAVVEEFMNIHIATNIGLTIVLFLLVYGSYFLATYLSCKRIVTEQRELETNY